MIERYFKLFTQGKLAPTDSYLLILFEAYTTKCYDDSMVFRISSKLFDNMDVALEDFYLQDYKCQGTFDKNNLDIWLFNISTLSSCGTIMKVRYTLNTGQK